LEEIAPLLRAHPHVIELRWQIYAMARHWHDAVEIGQALVRLVPDNPEGLHRSYALHELKATGNARDLLLPAAAHLPHSKAVSPLRSATALQDTAGPFRRPRTARSV
jgi:hypothetical protein